MFTEAFNYTKSQTVLEYKDIDNSAWYAPYIAAAVDNGLINGISDEQFGIGMPITRQDICVIIMRAMKGEVQEGTNPLFADSDDISEYAREAVAYLNDCGIINGFEDGTFMPKNNCTRAQAAKIICTLINLGGITE